MDPRNEHKSTPPPGLTVDNKDNTHRILSLPQTPAGRLCLKDAAGRQYKEYNKTHNEIRYSQN
eukprot:scaffold25072_cov68-Cyclotella_meneghiniana.AAC.4